MLYPNEKVSRRNLLKVLASSALLVSNARLLGQDTVPRIRITLNYAIGLWFFNPVGLYLEKGQTVEWLATRWGPTVTAFHPSNGNQELRIPEEAEPFDSGVLAREDTFRWTFDVEGTYDYFSKNHLGMGVVGRIIVGRPGGPGEMPPRYGGAQGRAPIYPRAMPVFEFLDSQEIVRQKTVSFPTDRLGNSYPEY
jgi:plastocyanin